VYTTCASVEGTLTRTTRLRPAGTARPLGGIATPARSAMG